MAENKVDRNAETRVLGGVTYKRIGDSFDPSTSTRRDDANFTVSNTGYAVSNTECAELADTLAAKAGITERDYHVIFGADDVGGTVSMEIVDSATPGAQQIKRRDDGRTFSIHLGGVFRQYPKLRPASAKRACSVQLATEGTALIIALKASRAKTKRRQSKEQLEASGATRGQSRIRGSQSQATPATESEASNGPATSSTSAPSAPSATTSSTAATGTPKAE